MKMTEMLPLLLELPDDFWNAYAFAKDPVGMRLSKRQRIVTTSTCTMEAEVLAKIQRKKNLYDILREESLKLKPLLHAKYGATVLFAVYEEPGTIYVNHALLDGLEENPTFLQVKAQFLELDKIPVRDIIIAHELYHYLERILPLESKKKQSVPLFSNILWLCCGKRIPALGEVSAMSFAKTFFSLSFSPFVLDFILLSLDAPDVADAMFQKCMDWKAAHWR